MKKFLVILTLAVSTFSLSAQTADSPWWMTVELSHNKLDYKWYDGMFNFGEFPGIGLRVGLERYLNPSFDVELGASYGGMIHEKIMDGYAADLDLRFAYKFANGYLLKEDSRVAPYIYTGFGITSFSSIEPIYEEFGKGTYKMMPFGAGLRVKVSENAEINLRGTYKNSIDYSPNYLQYTIGTSFSLGGKKDTDGDGVLDKEDACPTEAGPAENQGCPWPDTDGDGVLDKDDACPTEAGPAANKGCPWPDTDGDGVLDKDDACPTVAGPVANKGCPWPDTDGDGVLDKDDKCPTVAGPASNDGCPIVEDIDAVQDFIALSAREIQFELNSSKLTAESFPTLDKVVEVMKAGDFSIDLNGYADITGTPEYNLQLSKERAESVKTYLVGKGIAANRLHTTGYGIANPVASNDTRAGRILNRRVEMRIGSK
ncbi:OmpA family protein [Roseivirga echinicomitans]